MQLTDIIAEGYALCEKIANQKKGVEMRIDGDNYKSVDFEGAYDCIISDARLIVGLMKQLTEQKT